MTLLADVNISPRVVERLRGEGFHVVRVGDALDIRAPDEDILAEAARLGAVVVSRDQDFSAILSTTGAIGPSLINLRVSEVEPARLSSSIATVLRRLETELLSGAIVTVDDGGVRVHPLPVA